MWQYTARGSRPCTTSPPAFHKTEPVKPGNPPPHCAGQGEAMHEHDRQPRFHGPPEPCINCGTGCATLNIPRPFMDGADEVVCGCTSFGGPEMKWCSRRCNPNRQKLFLSRQ